MASFLSRGTGMSPPRNPEWGIANGWEEAPRAGRAHREWEQLALLCRWPEQLAYEEIHPLTLFETPRALPQARLFALDALGEGGWLKAMRLEGYAPRTPRWPLGLQQTLFAHHEALG